MNALPLLVLAASLATSLAAFTIPERLLRLRAVAIVAGPAVQVALVARMVWGVLHGESPGVRAELVPGVELILASDALSLLFAALSAPLWLLTTVYAVGYLGDGPHRRRFFGFFGLCITATMGLAFAGNPVTFLVFYELLTVATYPLVVHAGTPEALRGGRVYLAYTLAGGTALFLGTAWLHAAAGPVAFVQGGALGPVGLPSATAIAIFALLVAGLGVKAALVPLHRWLPAAMVAPAPVSALLHAVAVVKAGAFGIVRVVYELYGVRYAAALGVLGPLAALAAVTILWGSLVALRQRNLKRRLAWSTVSQVSYIALGAAVVGPLATVGGIVHLVHQGLMKITLFFCAGILAKELHVHEVGELQGTGRRLPLTMAAFTAAAFGMIGAPPLAGFVSKWYLGAGGLAAGEGWVVAVLLGSTLLNAAYFLPLVARAWFDPPAAPHPPRRGRLESGVLLLLPPVITALLAIAAGLFAGSEASPLFWARDIAVRELYP